MTIIRSIALVLAALLALLLCGCSSDRAQVAADTRAGTRAAQQVLGGVLAAGPVDAAVAKGIGDAIAILQGVDNRLPSVAAVNSADWPEPSMTVEAIKLDPIRYGNTAPPEPSRGTPWGTVAAAGAALLWLTGRLAPGIPGLGPLVGSLADGAWALLAHTNQKAAEAGQVTAAQTAIAIQPLAQALLDAVRAGTVPTRIADHITPDISSALAELAAGTATRLPAQPATT